MFTLIAGLSLLIWLATVALWIASYWRIDTFALIWKTWKGDYQYTASVLDVRMVRGYWQLLSETAEHSVMKPQNLAGMSEYEKWKHEHPEQWDAMHTTLIPADLPPGQMLLLAQPNRYGFGYLHAMNVAAGYTYHARAAVLHFAWTSPLFLILPLRWLSKHMHKKWRLSRGECPNCGYDLRASPDKCPECGTVPT